MLFNEQQVIQNLDGGEDFGSPMDKLHVVFSLKTAAMRQIPGYPEMSRYFGRTPTVIFAVGDQVHR